MKDLTINSLTAVVATKKVLKKHPARDWGYLYGCWFCGCGIVCWDVWSCLRERGRIRLDEEAKERKNPQLNNNSFMHDSMSHAHTYLSVVVLALGCRLGSLLLMA